MFDPFENRASRDIRNQLSEIFLLALEAGNADQLKKAADELRKKAPDNDHLNFIDDRVRRYEAILDNLSAGTGSEPPDPFETALCLWERELFFECHEWLEPLWQNASGVKRKALQGIIRAAGALVLEEAGRHAAAASSSGKAITIIEETRESLPSGFEPGQILSTLASIASDS